MACRGLADILHRTQALVFPIISRVWVPLKEHVALDRTSWSIESVCNRLFKKKKRKKKHGGWRDVLKLEYNDQH